MRRTTLRAEDLDLMVVILLRKNQQPAAVGLPVETKPQKSDYPKNKKPDRSRVFVWDAGPTGLEPATSAVTGRRSNQTELQSQNFQCQRGPKRDRTADLLNAIQALSQLSYGPIIFEESQIYCPFCSWQIVGRTSSQKFSPTPPTAPDMTT